MKRIILSAAVLVMFAIPGFAGDLRGRDVAGKGNIQTMEGSLAYEKNEWYVTNSSGKFLIHIGPEFYQNEIGLKFKANEKVKITGYVYQNSIAPQTVTYNEKIYKFRDSNGRPLWAGRGKRRNQNVNFNRNNVGNGSQEERNNGFRRIDQ